MIDEYNAHYYLKKAMYFSIFQFFHKIQVSRNYSPIIFTYIQAAFQAQDFLEMDRIKSQILMAASMYEI